MNGYGIIWDVDGTLVDTAELHFQAWVALARAIGKPFTRADFAGTFGWRNPEIIPKLFGKHYSDAEVADLGNRKESLYRAEAKKGLALLPGVKELLPALDAAGFKQAIGSSAPRMNVDLILDMTGIHRYIPYAVAMEDTAKGKPNPDVFLIAARKMGIAPERCLVFEDAPVGVEAAKAGGMKAIGVTFVGHHPAEKLDAAGADRIVHSLAEVSVAAARSILGIDR
ncbi:MAG: HAD family phosphatase [Gemmataceae bacterium]